MMRTSYDPDADAFYARFAPDSTEIAETKEIVSGVMIDVDASGQLVGIEVLSVSVRGNGAYAGAPVLSAAQ